MKNCAFNAFEQRVMGRNAYFSLFILIYDFVLLIYIFYRKCIKFSSLDLCENNILFFIYFLLFIQVILILYFL